MADLAPRRDELHRNNVVGRASSLVSPSYAVLFAMFTSPTMSIAEFSAIIPPERGAARSVRLRKHGIRPTGIGHGGIGCAVNEFTATVTVQSSRAKLGDPRLSASLKLSTPEDVESRRTRQINK